MIEDIKRLIDKHSDFYDDIAVYLTSGLSKKVMLNDGEPESFEYKDSINVSIRALKGTKAIASGFTGFNPESLDNFLEESKGAVGLLPEDPFSHMPPHGNFEADILVDSEFESCDMDRLKSIANDITEAALNHDNRVSSVKQAVVAASKVRSDILTTCGHLVRERTIFASEIYLIASDGDSDMDCYASRSELSLAELGYEQMAVDAVSEACELLNASSVKTGEYQILFSASVMADFTELLLELADGDNVFKKRSMLGGKIGEVVASSALTLVDDPFDRGVGSFTFDDEGQAAVKTEIISGGVLNSYLHNSYSAKALGMPNSANASALAGGNIAIESSNVSLLSTTDKMAEDVLDDYMKITEIMGMHTADPISGDFSVGISGVYYKDGEEKPFKEAVLSGNLKDLLGGLKEVFGNRKRFSGVTVADALFDKMMVSGE